MSFKDFDSNIWTDRLKTTISERVPGVLFGPVGLERGDISTNSFSYLDLPTNAVTAQPVGGNGLMVVILSSAVEPAIAGDRDAIDDCLAMISPHVEEWFARITEQHDVARVLCKIKSVDPIRMVDKFESAVRFLILAKPLPESYVHRDEPIPERRPKSTLTDEQRQRLSTITYDDLVPVSDDPDAIRVMKIDDWVGSPTKSP